MPKALITGIAGQDGSYLSEFLLEKGYKVHGVIKAGPEAGLWRLADVLPDLQLHVVDLNDEVAIKKIIESIGPDEIYNLASPSFVPNSWLAPVATGELSGMGVTKILESIRAVNPNIKFYQASSAELFGQPLVSPQNEQTPFNPANPYAVAKLYGYYVTGLYRKRYGMCAVSGINYNHESPRRSEEFVTRKITSSVAKIRAGKLKQLHLGNLDAVRDWGYAKDYVRVMWLMLQNAQPNDFVIATGQGHTVREFAEVAFSQVGLDYRDYVVVDEKFFRPLEKFPLVGDASKAKKVLGWSCQSSFEDLVQLMIEADMKRVEQGVESSL